MAAADEGRRRKGVALPLIRPSGTFSPLNGEKGTLRYIRTRSAFGSYIGLNDASAAKRSPAISTS